MATKITFNCYECGDLFEETVQSFLDEPADTVMAPMLCDGCGENDDDEADDPHYRPEPTRPGEMYVSLGGTVYQDEVIR